MKTSHILVFMLIICNFISQELLAESTKNPLDAKRITEEASKAPTKGETLEYINNSLRQMEFVELRDDGTYEFSKTSGTSKGNISIDVHGSIKYEYNINWVEQVKGRSSRGNYKITTYLNIQDLDETSITIKGTEKNNILIVNCHGNKQCIKYDRDGVMYRLNTLKHNYKGMKINYLAIRHIDTTRKAEQLKKAYTHLINLYNK
jgi:hypothetical protein